jgi:hypothetical protein
MVKVHGVTMVPALLVLFKCTGVITYAMTGSLDVHFMGNLLFLLHLYEKEGTVVSCLQNI